MTIYKFIACDQELASFVAALKDEKIKSYNELTKMGFIDEQIQIR